MKLFKIFKNLNLHYKKNNSFNTKFDPSSHQEDPSQVLKKETWSTPLRISDFSSVLILTLPQRHPTPPVRNIAPDSGLFPRVGTTRSSKI